VPRPTAARGPWRSLALFGGIFALAMGFGFLAVWLALRL
jgi:hypothetical protein